VGNGRSPARRLDAERRRGLKDASLFQLDRLKNVINRAGEKIAAAEVESCRLQHPGLAEVAVVSTPDPVYGEAVAAVVVAVEGLPPTEAQFRAFVAERLAPHKLRSRMVVTGEPLPRTATGQRVEAALRPDFFGVPDAAAGR